MSDRNFAINKGKLSSDLSANGNKITGLAAPVSNTDAANKQYVDSSSGAILDDTVTQLSARGVKSSGIWTFVHGLIDTISVAWANVTGKPQWIVDAGNAKPTYTAAEVGAATASDLAAKLEKASGNSSIRWDSDGNLLIGGEYEPATISPMGAYSGNEVSAASMTTMSINNITVPDDVSEGTFAITADISDAVVVHDEDDDAHSDKFGEVMDAISDRPTTSSVTQALAAKANKPSSPTSGNFAGLDENGNLTDSGKKAADFVQFEADDDPESGEKTAVTIGNRATGSVVGIDSFVNASDGTASGLESHAEGEYTTASGEAAHAEGECTTASGDGSHAEGRYTTASGFYAHAEGSRSTSSGEATHAEGYGSVASHQTAFVWQGAPNSKNIADEPTEGEKYNDHGAGTFNINPVGGTDGFYIGSQNLSTLLAAYLRDNTAAYSSSAAYAVGAFCRYNGALYVCNTAIAAPGEAWTAAHWTAMPNVASLFSGDNTSLAGIIRYATVAATTTLADRTTNAVTITSSAVTLTFPASVENKCRDFLIYINATDFASGGSLSITLPSGASQYGDDFPAITAAGEHLVAVTEIAANKFYVRSIALEEVE